MKTHRGFTLLELLVVIAIIGILASVIMVSLGSAREKARDARRVQNLAELQKAMELYFDDSGSYLWTIGYFSNCSPNCFSGSLVPQYIASTPDDPLYAASYIYQHKEDPRCGITVPGHYAFYAKLENPSDANLATMTDDYDQCIRDLSGYNYRVGN